MQCRKSFRRSLIIYMFLREHPASMDFISPESEHPASTDFTGPTDSGIVHGGAGTSKHWCSGGGPPVRPETQTRCFVGRNMTASHYGTPGSRRRAACAARNRNPVTFRGSLRSVFVLGSGRSCRAAGREDLLRLRAVEWRPKKNTTGRCPEVTKTAVSRVKCICRL